MIFGRSRGKWHYWFAWRPVKIDDGRRAWLHGLAVYTPRLGDHLKRIRVPWELHVFHLMQEERQRSRMFGDEEIKFSDKLLVFEKLIERKIAEEGGLVG